MMDHILHWLIKSRLQEEHDSFRDLADRMMEDKDKEISRILYENNKLQRSLDLELKVCSVEVYPQFSFELGC